MKFNSNVMMLIAGQIAILIVFNIINNVDWWMNLLLAAPIILVTVHFLLKKLFGKGLFFLEASRGVQMNYINTQNFANNNLRSNNAMNAMNASNTNLRMNNGADAM